MSEKIKDFIKNAEMIFEENSYNLNPLSKITDVKQKTFNFFKNLYRSKNVLIFGDYDVDGITSTIMLKDIVDGFQGSRNIRSYIPSRYDGYSIDAVLLKALVQEYDFIVLLDNGTNKEIISTVKEHGLQNKIFIIDHHPDSSLKEEDFIINPALNDLKSATSTGILIHSLYSMTFDTLKQANIYKSYMDKNRYIKLATLSAFADIASKTNIYNRNIILNGIEEIKNSEEFLFKNQKENDIITELNFKIIPMINSLGRLGTATDINGFDFETLFFEYQDKEKFDKVYKQLKNLNSFRKEATNFFYNIAKKEYKNTDTFVFYHEHTPIGINGILAQKFFQNGINTICLSPNPANPLEIVGSGRGYNFKDAMLKFKEETGAKFGIGGHNVAFGIKIQKDDLGDFLEKFNSYNFHIPKNDIKIYSELFDLDEYFELAEKMSEKFDGLEFDGLPKIAVSYDNINTLIKRDFGNYKLLRYKDNDFLVSSEEAEKILNTDKFIADTPLRKNNLSVTSFDEKIINEFLEQKNEIIKRQGRKRGI